MTASWSAPIRVQPNTSVVRAIDRGQWQAPLGSSRGPTIRLLAACRRARVRQGQAFGGAEEAPSLTAAVRDGYANMRSGRENACGAGRTKEWNDKGRQKWVDASLTNKAPYKAPEPRTREPCQRALTHHQPHEECARPSRDPGIQTTSAQGARASGRSADSGGHGPADERHRGVSARHGTAGTGP